VLAANPAGVFGKSYIQYSVQLVLDRPMLANELREPFGCGGRLETTQLLATSFAIVTPSNPGNLEVILDGD
jgi:hypothetical protein